MTDHDSKPLQRHSKPLNEIDYIDVIFVLIIDFWCVRVCYGQPSLQSVARTAACTNTLDSLFLPDPELVNIPAPVSVAARSKLWVCGRSPAEIVGSNPTEGIEVCLL